MNAKVTIWTILAGSVVYGLFDAPTACEGSQPFRGVRAARTYPPPSTYFYGKISHLGVYPPVFYSYPVRAPYGRRRNALSSSIMILDLERKLPVRIRNPFVPPTATATAGPDLMSTGPLRIINPYVVKLGDPSVSAAAILPRQPQVIHPATMTVLPE